MKNHISVFYGQEKAINEKFFLLCREECKLLTRLLEHKENLIQQLGGKIKDTDTPDYSIELMLSYNLSLFNSSLTNLSNGYLGVSQIILRVALENTCLAMYFYEFPDDEKKYRKNRKSFSCKLKTLGYGYWIEGWLKRIDKEGTKFTKLKGEKGVWYQRIFNNMVEEANLFVHVDVDFIYSLVFMKSDKEKSQYALGPNWSSDLLVKNALWKIIEACLYDCAVLDRVFKKHLAIIDMNLFEKVCDLLNEWKKYYNSQTKKLNDQRSIKDKVANPSTSVESNATGKKVEGIVRRR
ncbi:MAG: hypothetical protein ABII16_01395 [Patescibacteria group bacterium]